MPIFDYTCKQCKKEVEKIISYDKRKEPITCPYCNGELQFNDKLHKTGFQLKGGGWFNSGGY